MPNLDFYLPLDKTGRSPQNRITGEEHILTTGTPRLVIPLYSAYFAESLAVQHAIDGVWQDLDNTQYMGIEMLDKTTFAAGKEVLCAILILDEKVIGPIRIDYQALGGEHNPHQGQLIEVVDVLSGHLPVAWSSLIKPTEFPPTKHLQDIADLYGAEYIVDALKRVRDVIAVSDDVFHRYILTEGLYSRERDFYNTFDTHQVASADYIDHQSNAAEKVNLLVRERLLDIEKERIDIIEECDDVLEMLRNHRTQREYDLYAIVLAKLCEQQMLTTQTLMDLPKMLRGLTCWFDFSNTAKRTVMGQQFFHTDGQNPARRVLGQTSQLVTGALGRPAVRINGRNYLPMIGPVVKIDMNHTVLFIISKAAGTPVSVELLSNQQHSLSIDVPNRINAAIGSADQTQKELLAQTNGIDTADHHINVFTISDDTAKSIFRSNCLSSTYRRERGWTIEPTAVGPHDFNRIGNDYRDQIGDVCEIITYDRCLSQYEIDALMMYYQQKYGIRDNLLANGDFSDDFSEFETSYQLTYRASLPGEIAIAKRFTLQGAENSVLASILSVPGFDLLLRASPESNNLLLVRPDPAVNKTLIRRRIATVPGVSYRFSFLVYYALQAPHLPTVLKDGVALSTSDALDLTRPVTLLNYDFTADSDMTTMDVIAEANNTAVFALDDFKLIRRPNI